MTTKDTAHERQQTLLEWLEAHPGEWFAAGSIREQTNLYTSDDPAYEDLRRLEEEGYLEEGHYGWFMFDRAKDSDTDLQPIRGARLILDAHAIYDSAAKARIGYEFTVDDTLPEGAVSFDPDAARVTPADFENVKAAVLAWERGEDVFGQARNQPPVVAAKT